MNAATPSKLPLNIELFLLAVCSGLGVANVYYLQPSLQLVKSDLGATIEQIGWVPTLTQISYALGMLLLAPLGDVISRRKLIIIKSLILVLALIATGLAPNLNILLLSCMVVGLLGSVGQDFIPVAAQVAPEKSRGHAVGMVTTGLLTGILLSRTLGGFVADSLGWREMQFLAAGLMLVVILITSLTLAPTPPPLRTPYSRLLTSLWTLWGEHRALRLSMVVQGLLAATLGAFWSCLALVLAAEPFHLGASVAGAFGIAGAAGALAAPLFGRLADRRGPLIAIRAGCALVIVSFIAMAALPPSLMLLGIGAVLFDLGVQAGLVSHQSIINSLDPLARSRLNGLMMAGAMAGMAVGAALGTVAFTHYGARGMFTFAAIAGIAALAITYLHHAPKREQRYA
ncbi:MFS transporter [Pseudomonas sp. B8(2017)]|uniref:MFS transporter n=1 Tax=Pseudomonas sp. B8(2017) TaxID=1981711 RepID=UPI000A1DA72D|nr:MFS transporter [Pseudomonas sp. B8(2017)]